MTYKTILVHVTAVAGMPARARFAARLAARFEAHLVGMATTGLTQFIYQCSAMAPEIPFVETEFRAFRERTVADLKAFEAHIAPLGVPSHEASCVDGVVEEALALQSRFCDLAVVGQSSPDEPLFGSSPATPQFMLLHSARPVLIHPHTGEFSDVGKHPLLAWDGSPQAARAITAAIPLLRLADKVTLAMFNARHEINLDGGEAGDALIAYLQRHGVRADLASEETGTDIGEALLSLARDVGVDLLVMGGYGHARVREIALGGATRTVLRSMDLPVMMAH